jgi:septal ring factor EnvC (AmiA/AmiB activator)
MGRLVITAIVVAAIVAGGFYFYSAHQKQIDVANQQAYQKQVADLRQQTAELKSENDRLKAELAKVQAEQANLAAQNDILSKAIAAYKSTGKMPDFKLPYPPK